MLDQLLLAWITVQASLYVLAVSRASAVTYSTTRNSEKYCKLGLYLLVIKILK